MYLVSRREVMIASHASKRSPARERRRGTVSPKTASSTMSGKTRTQRKWTDVEALLVSWELSESSKVRTYCSSVLALALDSNAGRFCQRGLCHFKRKHAKEAGGYKP